MELDFEVFRNMNKYISINNTGNAKQFGLKIGCCERTVYARIEELNNLLKPFGINVIYNKVIESYQYSVPGSIEIGIKFNRE
jgi:transcriptional antiterminator